MMACLAVLRLGKAQDMQAAAETAAAAVAAAAASHAQPTAARRHWQAGNPADATAATAPNALTSRDHRKLFSCRSVSSAISIMSVACGTAAVQQQYRQWVSWWRARSPTGKGSMGEGGYCCGHHCADAKG